jgi:glycyl-tRNA synthetase beta chain
MNAIESQHKSSGELLFEIGTEELPAGVISPSLKAMAGILDQKLSEARIGHGEIKTFGTPRRLTVVVRDCEKKQKSVVTEVTGPPYSVGFDSGGKPTKAAAGFARGQGVAVTTLSVKDTPKGKYLFLKKTVRGLATQSLLKTMLPETIHSIPLAKSMRWGNCRLLFARPVRWLLAIFDGRMVPFVIEGIKSGKRTYGHRFLALKPVVVRSGDEYLSALDSAFVVPDIEKRKEIIRQGADHAVRKSGGHILPDEGLLDTVVNLVEYPAVALGTFSTDFLRLPSEVLIQSMREHQKYFAVIDTDGRLKPLFVAVNNTPVADMSLVVTGHERVLRARLEDARFFFEEDSKIPLAGFVDRLKGLLFQARLGTVYEKTCRVTELTGHLSEIVSPQHKEDACRAAWLSKADLVSQMVGEFPKLQGIMGRIYAERSGEPKDVAGAIEEHYLPLFAGDTLPESVAGTLVSIADKLDTIVGCFGVDLIPTGTSDPFALRRQALGIIHTILAGSTSISLKSITDKAISLFGDKLSASPEQVRSNVLMFFRHRLENVMLESGFSKDVIDAALSASCDDPVSDSARIAALENLKNRPDFAPIAIAFKRIVNIIKQHRKLQAELIRKGGEALTYEDTVNSGLFQEQCESDLYEAFDQTARKVADYLQDRAYDRGLQQIARLKKPVDAFFDGVMVLAEEPELQKNRLALLNSIAGLFGQFADFSKLTT